MFLHYRVYLKEHNLKSEGKQWNLWCDVIEFGMLLHRNTGLTLFDDPTTVKALDTTDPVFWLLYLLDQTPQLLFISSHNFVRLLFKSGY